MAGGMAAVHLAEDRKHHRPVALEVLRPELAACSGVDYWKTRSHPAKNGSTNR